MKKLTLMISSYLAIGLSMIALTIGTVMAAPLEKDTPTGNATDQIDLSINPDEILPANGTVILSTSGTNDIDINDPVPPGTTVMIESDQVTITNKEVSPTD